MIANIKAGDILNQTTFSAALHISRNTLLKNWKRILEELEECYEFTYKLNKSGTNISKISFTKKYVIMNMKHLIA
jgi:predicted Ser/Thr protein kinase